MSSFHRIGFFATCILYQKMLLLFWYIFTYLYINLYHIYYNIYIFNFFVHWTTFFFCLQGIYMIILATVVVLVSYTFQRHYWSPISIIMTKYYCSTSIANTFCIDNRTCIGVYTYLASFWGIWKMEIWIQNEGNKIKYSRYRTYTEPCRDNISMLEYDIKIYMNFTLKSAFSPF